MTAQAIHPRDSGLPATFLAELLIGHRTLGGHFDRLK